MCARVCVCLCLRVCVCGAFKVTCQERKGYTLFECIKEKKRERSGVEGKIED